MQMKFYLSVLTLSLLSVNVSAECKERLGALDFGSGTTKALVVEVDRCQKTLGAVLLEERLAIAFNEALEKSSDNKIPNEIVKTSIVQYQQLVQKMKELKVNKINAVATSVFRVAQNGGEVIAEISKAIATPIEIIPQEREAELGYWSALAAKGLRPNERVIVWDIGGGSMQMYSKRQGKVYIYNGDMASVSFKNRVISEIQKNDPKTQSSPNPLGTKRNAAVKLASEHAKKNTPEFFKENAQKYRWIGVGGVLSLSVQGQTKKDAKTFSKKELERALSKRSFLSDTQIESEYRVTDITNLALVLGYMQQLKVTEIETAKVTLGQGLIFEQLQSLKE